MVVYGGVDKMNCSKCKSLMYLDESYKRGMWYWEVYLCLNCGHKERVKVRKLGDNTGSGIKAKGCTVKWGKSKTHKFNPKKKDKPKKRRGY